MARPLTLVYLAGLLQFWGPTITKLPEGVAKLIARFEVDRKWISRAPAGTPLTPFVFFSGATQDKLMSGPLFSILTAKNFESLTG